MYLYCADTSVSDFEVSFLIWNTLTVRSARSPFSSNDTTPWIVGTLAVWMASRTVSRVTGYDTIIPLPRLEQYYMPSVGRIVAAAREVRNFG